MTLTRPARSTGKRPKPASATKAVNVPTSGAASPGARQRQAEPLAEQIGQHELGEPADRDADQRGDGGDEGEAQEEPDDHLATARPEGAHHGAGVGLALGEVADRERDRGAREQHGHHRGEPEEAPRPIERAGHLRAAVANADQACLARHVLPDPVADALERAGLPGHQQREARPARRTEELGRLEIALVHHHPRGELEGVLAAVGLVGDQPLDGEVHRPEGQRITGFERERGEQLRVDPDGAGGGRRAPLDSLVASAGASSGASWTAPRRG